MAKIIKNIDTVSHTYSGQVIESGQSYSIQLTEEVLFKNNISLIQDISDGKMVINDGIVDLSLNTSIRYLQDSIFSSLAVDKNNTEQDLTDDSWTTLISNRILWDKNGDYATESEDLIVPFTGIYFFDLQIKVENLLNVEEIEIALFKRGTPDDYWFILDKKNISSETSVQLSGATSFDFVEGDRYCIKVKLYGTDCTATICGGDDYSAWGYELKS